MIISLSDGQSPDSRVDTEIPVGLVAAFVAVTSRKHTSKPFVKHARRSRVSLWPFRKGWQLYCNMCPQLNSVVLYTINRLEPGLGPKVDGVCHNIKSREKAINLLFRCTRTLLNHAGTLASVLWSQEAGSEE